MITINTQVLNHKDYTGVENYVKYLLQSFDTKENIKIAKPKTKNKYLIQLWMHFILPFKKTNILFCPANIAPIFLNKKKKLILTIHDLAFLEYRDSFSLLFRLYYKFLIPINIKRADAIITVSKFSKEKIEKYYPNSRSKVKVIYLGVSQEFKVINIKKMEYILYVGSLNDRKNFAGVIKAFNALNKKTYKLLIVGNFSSNFKLGKINKNILELAKSNKNIRFLKNINNLELVKLYNQSSLFIFPSFYEGFGLPLLEAMACGTPVLSSKTSCLQEIGANAIRYCNPYSVQDIANKIQEILGNNELQKQMALKGLQRAKLFSWKKTSKKHLEVIKNIEKVK